MAGDIIGRREELRSLRTFLTALPAGGQALLLEGDPGIGKTTLWHDGVRAARDDDYRVLTARPAQSETRIVFATLGDLLGPALEVVLPQLQPLQRRALETALLLRESEGPPPEARALALAVQSVVVTLAQERPLLLALDDVQWVDSSSAAVLCFVLRRLEDAPVGVLATVRGRPLETPLELDRNLASFTRLQVEPLSMGAIHRLIWGRLALNLPRPVLAKVHEASGGNPFFALELGRALVEGTIRPDSAHVSLPASLRPLVARRLEKLPPRARGTLVAVAALASPSVSVLAPLSVTTVDDIELAESRGLLELDGDRIRFTHPLLAPACYEAMPLHRRRQLHRRLADLDLDPEERARHLAIAAVEPDQSIAAALDEAALHARARGAAQVAAELAERAVALTPADEIESIDRRRITAARHCIYSGDTTKAGELLEYVVDTSVPGPLRAEALCGLAGVRATTEGNPAAEGLLRRALSEPGIELRQRADILGSLASQATVGGDSRSGVQYAEEALALAEELGDAETLASALTTFAEITFWRTGRIQRGPLERAIEIGRRTDGTARFADSPRMTLAFQLGRADHFEEARLMWEALIAAARTRADPQVVVYLFFLARMEVASGEWGSVERLCDEATALGRQIGRQMNEHLCLMILAEVDAYRGRAEKARGEIPGLLRVAVDAGYGGAVHRLSRALGSLELSCGRADACRQLVEPLFAGVTEMDEVLAQLAGSVGIEALLAVDDLPAAEKLFALLDERAATSDTALRPLADRCRGLLLAAHGEHEAAIDALEAASVIPDPPQQANPLELARTRLALGTVQRQARHKRAARETLDSAAESFEHLGALLWAEKTRAELRRIGGRTASEHELSETEQRIVELVVAGRRNREVANELSLSPNTVAWNLSKVYRKLGVSSRTELAAHMTATPRA